MTGRSERIRDSPLVCVARTAAFTLMALVVSFSLGERAHATSSPPMTGGPPPAWVEPVEGDEDAGDSTDIASNGVRYRLRDNQVRVGPDLVEQYWHWSKRIVNASGLQAASQISIDFDPTYQSLVMHSVTVHRDGQTFDRLQLSSAHVIQREPNLEAQIYDGRQSAVVFVSDLRVGDILDWAYTLRGSDPTLEGVFVDTVMLGLPEPIGRLRTRLLEPSSRHLSIATAGPESAERGQPAVTVGPDVTEYLWDQRRLPPLPIEADLPEWYSPLPFAEVSDAGSWHNVAVWGTRMFRTAAPVGPLHRWVQDRLHISSSPDEFLLGAIRFVQDEVRYVAIEVGLARRRPSEPNAVFDRRYGDCKEKTSLLVAILADAGVRAWPALVNSRRGHMLDGAPPSPGAFDHVIVKVLGGGGQIYWVDPTFTWQGGGLKAFQFSSFERALVLDEATAGLETIEARPPTNSVTISERFGVAMPGEKHESTRLDALREYRGALADAIRAALHARSREETEKYYLSLYEPDYPAVRSAGPLELTDDRELNIVRLETRYTIPNLWMPEEGEKPYRGEFAARAISTLLRRPKDGRVSPFALAYPLQAHHRVDIDLPFDLPLTPDTVVAESPALRFEFASSRSPRAVHYDYDLRTMAAAVAVADLAVHAAAVDRARVTLARSLTYKSAPPDGLNGWAIAVVLLSIPALVWGAVRLSRYDRARVGANAPDARTKPLASIGGWLLLVGFNLAVTPPYLLWTLRPHVRFLGSLAKWRALTTVGYPGYNPAIAGLVLVETVINLWLVVYTSAVFVLFLQKRHRFVLHFTALYLSILVSSGLDMIAAGVLMPDRPLSSGAWTAVVRAATGSLVWIPYVQISRRVQHTFVR